LAAVLFCAAFAVANPSAAAAFGRGGFAFHGGGFGGFRTFHGGLRFRGFHGFYGGGIYPYSLLGGYYPRYLYGNYYSYPYSVYEDDEPDCHFVWVKRTVRHRLVRHGIWTCF
jgi:hypothetical protein